MLMVFVDMISSVYVCVFNRCRDAGERPARWDGRGDEGSRIGAATCCTIFLQVDLCKRVLHKWWLQIPGQGLGNLSFSLLPLVSNHKSVIRMSVMVVQTERRLDNDHQPWEGKQSSVSSLYAIVAGPIWQNHCRSIVFRFWFPAGLWMAAKGDWVFSPFPRSREFGRRNPKNRVCRQLEGIFPRGIYRKRLPEILP